MRKHLSFIGKQKYKRKSYVERTLFTVLRVCVCSRYTAYKFSSLIKQYEYNI